MIILEFYNIDWRYASPYILKGLKFRLGREKAPQPKSDYFESIEASIHRRFS